VVPLPKIRSSATRFFVDQYDLSGDLNAGNQGVTQPEIDTTCFAGGPSSLVDYYQTKDDWNGFFARTVGVKVIDDVLNDLIGDENDHYLLKLFAGNTENAGGLRDDRAAQRQPHQWAGGRRRTPQLELRGIRPLLSGDGAALGHRDGHGQRHRPQSGSHPCH
jgi:hypothetical protein